MDYDWLRFAKGQILFSFACLLLVFLVVMAAEFFHYVSDGRVPRFIEWQPTQTHRFNIIECEDDEEEHDEDVSPFR